MFIPTGTENAPDVNELDRVRVTDTRFCVGDKTETVREPWISSGGRSITFKKRWTGCSIFQSKVAGKQPAEVKVIGEPDDKHEISMFLTVDGLELNHHAIAELTYCS